AVQHGEEGVQPFRDVVCAQDGMR
ncbi:MAG: hypothetical protein RIS92_1257, partial [Verrucomicrobiota bacterium]